MSSKKRYFVCFEGGAADPDKKGAIAEHPRLSEARWWCRLMQGKREAEPEKDFARPLCVLRVKFKQYEPLGYTIYVGDQPILSVPAHIDHYEVMNELINGPKHPPR